MNCENCGIRHPACEGLLSCSTVHVSNGIAILGMRKFCTINGCGFGRGIQ